MVLEVREIDNNSWDSYFIKLAEIGACRSKDKRTKVGSCIVKDKKVLSIGYNGAPRKFPDEEVPDSCDSTLSLKDCKYSYICHSELNAILNYGGSLKDLDGASIYVTTFPCHECAKAIIQVGIKKVIFLNYYDNNIESNNMAKLLFDKCNVEYIRFGDK